MMAVVYLMAILFIDLFENGENISHGMWEEMLSAFAHKYMSKVNT